MDHADLLPTVAMARAITPEVLAGEGFAVVELQPGGAAPTHDARVRAA